MLHENSMALKEWAAVCAALSTGRQSLLLRKGGIAEARGGFRLERDEFWLLPTQFHQSGDQLTDEGASLLSKVLAPEPGRLRIDSYAIVRAAAFISDESQLARLEGWHVMSAETVRQRFHYRRPGLFVAAVDVFVRSAPVELVDLPRYAGCHSWVELEEPISAGGLCAAGDAQRTAAAVELVRELADASR